MLIPSNEFYEHEVRARPSDDGCVQPRRRPHTEVRRVSTAVTTLCRGARNTANHQTGRYPPYQWFNRENATCASRQRAPRLLCRLFCCKRLALKDNDTVWYSALYHQCDIPRRTQKWFMACRIVLVTRKTKRNAAKVNATLRFILRILFKTVAVTFARRRF